MFLKVTLQNIRSDLGENSWLAVFVIFCVKMCGGGSGDSDESEAKVSGS